MQEINNDQDFFINNKRYKFVVETLISYFPELSHIDPDEIIVVSNIKTDNRGKKSKTTYADITKLSDKLFDVNKQYYLGNKPYKYILQIYENHVEGLTKEQLVVVIYHELLHISVEGNLRNHDFEDFYQVIDKVKNTRWGQEGINIDSILSSDLTKQVHAHLDNTIEQF